MGVSLVVHVKRREVHIVQHDEIYEMQKNAGLLTEQEVGSKKPAIKPSPSPSLGGGKKISPSLVGKKKKRTDGGGGYPNDCLKSGGGCWNPGENDACDQWVVANQAHCNDTCKHGVSGFNRCGTSWGEICQCTEDDIMQHDPCDGLDGFEWIMCKLQFLFGEWLGWW